MPAVIGSEGIKLLKTQLDKLIAAKAHLAGDPLLGHMSASLEAQMQGIRGQIASAQPLEVALRSTLGAVATARQSLTRAESKATKCESQVVAAVAAYEAAAAEVQACKKALADAEAETARTAGGRFDPKLLIGAHPGAALAVLSEAAAARCVVGMCGVDAVLASRVHAAFQEVQAVCRLLLADVPPPAQDEQQQGGAAPPGHAGAVAQCNGDQSSSQMGEGASGGSAGAPQGSATAEAIAPVDGGVTSAQAAAAAQQQLQQHIQQQQLQHQHQQHQAHLQQQSQPQQHIPPFDSAEDAIAWAQQQQAAAEQQQRALAQQQSQALAQQQQQLALAQQQELQLRAQSAAAELARQHAQAALTQAAAQPGATATSEPAPRASSPASAAPTSAGDSSSAGGGSPTEDVAAVPVAPRDDGDLATNGPAGDANGTVKRDDSMGGGATDAIVNKRTAAEAVETARVIAAKAKARAA